MTPDERGRHSSSTPMVMKVTSIVYNPPFQKFLNLPLDKLESINLIIISYEFDSA